jgi:hypothetical protein
MAARQRLAGLDHRPVLEVLGVGAEVGRVELEGQPEGLGNLAEIGKAESGVGAASNDVVGKEVGLGLAD